jgi:hypothetical protein
MSDSAYHIQGTQALESQRLTMNVEIIQQYTFRDNYTKCLYVSDRQAEESGIYVLEAQKNQLITIDCETSQ